MKIYCVGCQGEVEARLTSGVEIYPHRPDLGAIPFWKCDGCGNFVGCHYKDRNPTRPLGNIPTSQLRGLRGQIHRLLDPLWQGGGMSRGAVYAILAEELGQRSYHTAEIQSVAVALRVVTILRRLSLRVALRKPCYDFPDRESSR